MVGNRQDLPPAHAPLVPASCYGVVSGWLCLHEWGKTKRYRDKIRILRHARAVRSLSPRVSAASVPAVDPSACSRKSPEHRFLGVVLSACSLYKKNLSAGDGASFPCVFGVLMNITPQEVRHVADLARLELSDEEVERMTAQLDPILGYMAKLNELETTDVAATTHPHPLVNAFREDEVRPSLARETALANSPAQNGEAFVVPRVIG
jgi:aspartyl-tRNA(Asn)/glutamyl-tRNA(Gln) amidotransferase subunit C